jgi:PHP family Zn ribbon phosphoesterase
MATAEVTEKLCTKCGKNPKAGGPKDTNPWCQECRTAYQRERSDTLEWRAERRGLIRGIQAMRLEMANYFRQWGGRPFMGAEVASTIDSLPGPSVAAEKTQ